MTFTARIIAAYGRHLVVRDAQGNERTARPFGRKLQVVCGDRVTCEIDTHHDEAHVTAVLPRDSCLYRTNLRADEEAVVANLTLMLVTLAPLPVPDLFVIDRYLAAAASAGIRASLVLNKSELPWPPELASELAVYATVGYTNVAVSAKTDTGMESLRSACAGDIAAFVGQSGVGKSSLISRLVPEADIRTGELMLRTQEGTHTTTASHLYDLAGGGHLIDSPGVRDFAPALSRLERLRWDFSRSRSRRRTAGSMTVDICANRPAPCAPPATAGKSARAGMRVTGVCDACLKPWVTRKERDESRGRAERQVALTHHLAPDQCVRERAAIHVFEFPAYRHAVGNARCLNAACKGQFAQIVCRGFPLHRRVGGEDEFLHRALGQQRLELTRAEFIRTHTIQRRQMTHQHEVVAAIATREFHRHDIGR